MSEERRIHALLVTERDDVAVEEQVCANFVSVCVCVLSNWMYPRVFCFVIVGQERDGEREREREREREKERCCRVLT